MASAKPDVELVAWQAVIVCVTADQLGGPEAAKSDDVGGRPCQLPGLSQSDASAMIGIEPECSWQSTMFV